MTKPIELTVTVDDITFHEILHMMLRLGLNSYAELTNLYFAMLKRAIQDVDSGRMIGSYDPETDTFKEYIYPGLQKEDTP
jgi:hypothetical protein